MPLANEQFTKETFEINANQANQGLLNIKSNFNLESISLNILRYSRQNNEEINNTVERKQQPNSNKTNFEFWDLYFRNYFW